MERKPERKKAADFPQELLNLLDGYVHGGVSRRQFLDRAQKFAVGGVTAASLFQMLKPNYAWAIQVQPDDKRIKSERQTVQSPDGNGSIKGYLVRPANDAKLPTVLVIHENRGLNPYIEDVARRLAVANFIAFAPDALTSLGGYPGDDEKALAMFVAIYGSEAGNMALRALPFGGVYVGGGIALKILAKLKDGTFVRAFCNKTKLANELARIPIFVVLNQDAPVLGAAYAAFAAAER